MNKVIAISISILGGLAAVCVIILLFFGTPKTTTQPSQSLPSFSGVPTSPASPSTSQSNTQTASTSTITITGNSGSVVVDDFLHNGSTQPDPENPGLYFIAGSSGYCMSNGVCPGGASSTDFYIVYDSKLQLFTITLLKEPIGQIRTEVEQFMLNLLGISQGQLCTINYYLGTQNGLNDFYSGQNLGFSFCPGAVTLP